MAVDERMRRRRRAIGAAVVVSVATTALTGSAHSLAGGTAPDALLLLAAFVVTLAVLAPVLGARASLVRQATAVGLAQLVQHALYALPHGSGGAVHAHGDAARDALAAASLDHGGAGMPLAHVVAGALTLALVRRAPRALAVLLRAVSLRAVALVLAWAPTPVRPPARALAAARPAPRPRTRILARALARRGPPALV